MPGGEDPALPKMSEGAFKKRGRHTGKGHDAWKESGQEEESVAEGEMVAWRH